MLSENQLVQAFNAERNGAKFPIKFDDAWKKLGYSRKDAAKRAVLSKLIENEDYIIDSTSKWNLSTTDISSLSAQEKAALLLREDIYLSCDGYDHFCMLSDTPEGREERIRFIGYKKAYIAGLERALLSEPNPEVEALKQENTRLSERVTELEAKIGATVTDRLEFPYSSKQLHRDSRIASHSYVVGAIKRDFVEGNDYQVVENEIFMTEQLYLGFMLSFRSEKGADISALPDTLLIITKFFFQFQQARSKKNARVAQSDKYKQMELLEYN